MDAGPKPAVTVSGPGGIRIRAISAVAVSGFAVLGRGQPPSRPIDLNLAPGSPVIPDTGDGRIWQIRLEMPGTVGRVDICAVSGG
jgi:hypothetical protein